VLSLDGSMTSRSSGRRPLRRKPSRSPRLSGNAGARGYLLKDAEPDTIIRAIAAVREGQAIFDRGIASRVIAATGTPRTERPFPILTEREYEILDRLARGLRNDAISARMGISIKTVQNNVSTILLKLGAADRAQAVALARDAGMGHHP
jgi:DNA-binding NarL/FixJ family response regulator